MRRPLIAGTAAALLLLLLVGASLWPHARPSNPGSSPQPMPPPEPRQAEGPPAHEKTAPEAAELPDSAEGQDEVPLEEQFRRHVEHLRRLVDEEGGLSLLYEEGEVAIAFIKQHASRFREDIRRICLERGSTRDPFAQRLYFTLPEEEQDALIREETNRIDSLMEGLDQHGPQGAHVMLDLAYDSKQPIGLRIRAILEVASRRDPALQGVVISLLDSVREPALRAHLYWFLFATRHEVVRKAVVEKAILALEQWNEPRGTTIEILENLDRLYNDSRFQSAKIAFATRMDAALAARLRQETAKEKPDDTMLLYLAKAASSRTSIPQADETRWARETLTSTSSAAARRAAAYLLLPHRAEQPQDSAAKAFMLQSKEILLPALRIEKDTNVVETILQGLARFPDPDMKRAFTELAAQRPELQPLIEKYPPWEPAHDLDEEAE
ncbi:MAG: hypothetical protein HYY16_09570 [Planctomycetes bacterium]|nr:hypothetical protein [Planctomycetota bacterium]